MYETRDNATAYKLSECGFNLPTFVGMTDEDVSRSCAAFVSALAKTN
jgi:dTDP-4-amino-4,6-dideoxygalactose transaminase